MNTVNAGTLALDILKAVGVTDIKNITTLKFGPFVYGEDVVVEIERQHIIMNEEGKGKVVELFTKYTLVKKE